MAEPHFKVLIAGGGPVGLFAAHIFHKAGIEFELLERNDTVIQEIGATVNLWPMSTRIVYQLGLGEVLEPLITETDRRIVLTQDGIVYDNCPTAMRDFFGRTGWLFHRPDLLRGLYEGLPDEAKTRIHTNKEITKIDTTNESGVTVTCADGTIFTGNIIIGADGINSRVRSLMRNMVLDAEGTKSPHLNDENPFEAKFMLLYGDAPRPPDLKPGMIYDVHGTGQSSSLFILQDRAQFFVYTRLDKPTRDRSKRFTQDEIDAHAEQGGDYFIAPGLRFRDLYSTRYSSGMTLLHEGMVPNWTYGGRIVLVGDAAHKLTTNLGFGLNSGIEDVVTLANHLHDLLQVQGVSDRGSLEKSFKAYESERLKAVPSMVSISGNYTGTCLWSGWMDWLLDRWVFPVINASWYIERYFMARIIANGIVLDFVEEKNLVSGTVPWKNRPTLIS